MNAPRLAADHIGELYFTTTDAFTDARRACVPAADVARYLLFLCGIVRG